MKFIQACQSSKAQILHRAEFEIECHGQTRYSCLSHLEELKREIRYDSGRGSISEVKPREMEFIA